MIYTVFNFKSNELNEILPDYLCEKINQGDIVSFCAIDDEENDRIVGFACFSDTNDSYFRERAILDTIFIVPEYRMMEYGKELLEYSTNYLRDYGYKSIYCKNIGSENEILENYSFFISCGFVPVTFFGRLVTYDMISFTENKIINKMLKSAEYDNHFCSIDDNNSLIYKKFVNSLYDSDVNTSIYDSSLSGFYIKDSIIRAAAFTRRISPNNIFIENSYCEPDFLQPKAIAGACIASVFSASKLMPHESDITLQYTDEKAYRVTVGLLGEPKNIIMFQEFLKPLIL